MSFTARHHPRRRSQTDQSTDQADAQTDESNHNEHLNNGIRGNSPRIVADPADGGGHDGPHIGNDIGQGRSSSTSSKARPPSIK